MSRATYTPIAGVIRVYDDHAGESDPHKAVVSVVWNDSTSAHMIAANGRIGISDIIAVFEKLREIGLKSAFMERAGNKRMPFATFCEKKGDFSIWKIDDIDDYISKLRERKPQSTIQKKYEVSGG
jgi:hypothetical protein